VGSSSVFSVFRYGLSSNGDWSRAWRDPAPKPAYDVLIAGDGCHGFATAYYLAREHGICRKLWGVYGSASDYC
jgi:sarcosine oxidase subunit beta